ncbi:SDR family NAD(P)-dependent oxidoreductase [Caenorhabditis elegans]|nr:SDR family NAD(P)-dependent oxidoreductase [Caenorhabditis elegans]CDH93018.1 SDR family NAD(P)-dependent oxidoreductase [Caenorhabditis elegans]|eukprot:NP_001293544.1 DeHydrogenases, Short chain [Caenorhabditis elegans]
MSQANRVRLFHSRTHAFEVLKGIDVSGKTFAITGTTSGIGINTAEVLALAGAHVVLMNRNLHESENQKKRILEKKPSAKVDIIFCDLSDLKTVRKAGEDYLAKNWPIHGLILNAGVFRPAAAKTKDGFESHYGVNVVAHFTLLRILLPVVRRSAPSRVVFLSSTLSSKHGFKKSMGISEKMSILQGEDSSASTLQMYGASKMADMLIAFKLHRDEYKNGISTYSVHPGSGVRTDIFRNSLLGKFIGFVTTPFTKNASQGAATTVYCATHPEVEKISGKYWESCWDNDKIDKKTARDEELQEALWKKLEQIDDRINGSIDTF